MIIEDIYAQRWLELRKYIHFVLIFSQPFFMQVLFIFADMPFKEERHLNYDVCQRLAPYHQEMRFFWNIQRL